MNKVKIITDSCADLTSELLEKYNIDYAKMSTILDGDQSIAYTTWSSEEAHNFYDIIRGGKRITTAQVSVEEFTDMFTKYLDEGFDIVYVGCSLKQSGSVNTGAITAKKLLEGYPNSEIYCIDSLNASIGEGMLAIEAAKLAEQGKSAKEIADEITAIRNNVREFITVHTLEYLKRAGRVSASSAFFGNLLGVKPVLVSDANGAQAAFKKVKGRQNSMNEVVSLLKEVITDSENQTVYVVHSDCCKEDIDTITNIVKDNIVCKDIVPIIIGPIVGASVGPDTIGVFAFGEEITFASES